jgi:glycosyltransferase involved in cell wall biosynthesis
MRVVRQRYGGGYLLHVGRIIPRKNVEKLIGAFDMLAARFEDLQLLLVGGNGYGSEDVTRRIAASPNRARIHQVGWISDEELRLLYASASVLVFPSRHEGFGLPVLEAMACGVPVVASKEAARVDVAGNAVVRADCSDAALLADALARVLSNASLRAHLACQGQLQAVPFNREACAAATLEVYRKAARGNSTIT